MTQRLIVFFVFFSACVLPGYSQVVRGKGHKIMIFGGRDHETYLGCLSCSEYATDSVLNEFGQHGSGFSSESIFNHFSEYGSQFSSYSACNEYATDPPVIVNEDGDYYGRLTLNEFHPQIDGGKHLIEWVRSVCEK